PIREELEWPGPTVHHLAVYAARLSGPEAGAVLVLHDTSDLRRLERLRQEFVANVSHELKTPLAVIKACVETLIDGAATDPDACDGFLAQINDQADRLHNLVLDLLRLARIESDTAPLDLHSVALADAVGDCLARHQARAEAMRLQLETDGPPVAVHADDEALDTVLENLVDNALKYTPAGGRVSIGWTADESTVRIEVEDTGVGIPERDLPRLFERFYRVDRARSRELGGTGLGLSIVKHLVQAMGGEVGVQSTVGRGSVFRIRLPLADQSRDAVPSSSNTHTAPIKQR
ncbi:MAG TPA: ATP-binding protein, partial [Gemmataceae bacterium]|nr:ATP-binding protein [Gemmataceae bacterium]